MNSAKLIQMFKFISQYKYEISENVPDNLKCIKCKNILINAYCVSCGCSYCCDCLNEMLERGVENCHGNTEDCKNELMSNHQVDHRRNRKISNVVMKCPEEMCVFECAIINMEEHSRVCEKKCVKCPFADDGCDGKKITREMLNDHCQSESSNHFKILIEIIDNMRNEIDILKANDEKNQLKIENLEKNLKSKDEIIDKINKEIQLVKLQRKTVKQELEDKFDNKMNRETMEIENEEQKLECDKIDEKLDINIEELFAEIQKEKYERIKSINESMMEAKEKSEMMEISINKLNKIVDYFGYAMIEWKIDKLDELRKKKDGWIVSEYFSGLKKLYNLQLLFYANGYGDIEGKGCSIYLCICRGSNDQLLTWPFSADVTIKVVSKTYPNIKKSITKYCIKDKPIDYPYNYSEVFNYLDCDLIQKGEILDNEFTIECFVDFK